MAGVRAAARVTALLAGAALAMSFLGALHPAGDSLAVFRLPMAAFLALAALLAGPRWRAGGLALALAAQGPMLAIRLAPEAPPGIHVHYQKNLWARLATPEEVLDDIAASGAQTIALQEVSARNQEAILSPLRARYRAHAYCPFAGVGGVAVLSSWPALGPPVCEGGRGDGMVALQVDHPDGPLWLVSLHLHWPWPLGQPDQLDRMVPRLAALEGRILVSGDFNMVRWARPVPRIAAATDTRAVGRAPTSFFLTEAPALRLAIDHVLLPGSAEGTLERRAYLGSDHAGLVARWQ